MIGGLPCSPHPEYVPAFFSSQILFAFTIDIPLQDSPLRLHDGVFSSLAEQPDVHGSGGQMHVQLRGGHGVHRNFPGTHFALAATAGVVTGSTVLGGVGVIFGSR